MQTRPSVREDFESLGLSLDCRVMATTGIDENGNVLGIAGLAYLNDGRIMAFSELSDEARRNKVSLHKAALRCFSDARERGVKQIVALADMVKSDAAERWLSRLGFSKQFVHGESIWVWRSE